MSEPLKIFKAEAFLIPLRQVEAKHISLAEELTTYRFYEEKTCSKCSYVEDRHCDTCETCPAFKSAIQLGKVIEKEGKDGKIRSYLSMPLGNQAAMKAWLRRTGFRRNFKILGKQPNDRPLSRSIKPIVPLRGYQEEAVNACLEHKVGVVKAPPRSGKTYIAAVGICRIGQKALILAHQREWLKNFRETFVGSDTQDPMTTAKEGQVGFCKSYEDFRDTDICLATFQQFMNKSGRKLLARIQSMFTVLVVDECHQAAATETSRVLARINSKYKWGLSGTPERKDEKYVIAENLLGKVLYEAKVERLRPRVQAIFTGIEFKMSNSQVGFTYLVNRMENHKVRKERVVKEAIRLAREGHLVMIPLARVRSIKEYVRLINEEAEAKWARAFYGGTGAVYKAKREKLIDDARNYKFKIIVGNISLLSTGLNIPRASAIIDRVTPTSNIPKAQQRLSRILTPWEDKPEPLVVLMLDNGDTMRNMARNEFWNVLYKMKPKIDDLTYKSLLAHFANKTSNFENLRDAV